MQHWSYEFDYALRSCFSVAVVVSLCLYPPIAEAVTHGGRHSIGPAFAAVAAVFGFEYTVGGTVRNICDIVLGAVLGTSLCSLTLLAFDDGGIPEAAIYPCVWAYTLLLSLLNLPLFSKKLSISLVALILVQRKFVPPTSVTAWWWFLDLVFGGACALLATVFPWPKMAGSDIERKGKKCAAVVATLYHETVLAWLFLKVELPAPVMSSVSGEDDDEDDRVISWMWMGSGVRNRHWRRILLVLAVVRKLQQRAHCCARRRKEAAAAVVVVVTLKWQHRPDARSCFASRSIRTELRKCAEQSLSFMQARAAEACYGPRYVRAVTKYPVFISLVRDLLLVQENAEGRLDRMQELINTGLARDVLRSFFKQPEFRRALLALAASFRSCMMRLSKWLTHERGEHEDLLLEAHKVMLRRLGDFDVAYHRGRMMCYYEEGIECLPPVVLSMNCLIFVLQHSVHLLSAFCETHVEPPPCNENDVFSQPWIRVPLLWLYKALRTFFNHCPSRSAVVSSLVLASSITLAAVYGLRSSAQPYLAAFTIAYINGGSVTGVNVATSLLRAAGTALACLYTLIVFTLIETFKQDSSPFDNQLIVGCAVVAFMIPSTYVRITEYIGYSGRVAAFSAALLLLSPLKATLVIERLIDTMLGIAVFLTFECIFSGVYTEALILDALTECVANLSESFLSCLETFRRVDAAFTETGAERPKDILPLHALASPALPSREVLVYSRLEPSVFKSPHFSPRMLEECVSRVDTCRQHLSFLSVVVSASVRIDSARMLPLQANLESIDVALVRTVDAILHTLDAERKDIHRSAWAVLAACPGACGRVAPLRPRHRRTVDELTAELREAGAGPGCDSHDCVASLNEEERKILSRFATLVADLRRTDDDGVEGDDDGSRGPSGTRMSNGELILVCAFLGVLQDLLEALKALKAQVNTTRNAKQVRLLRF